jgi:hypothetical protein
MGRLSGETSCPNPIPMICAAVRLKPVMRESDLSKLLESGQREQIVLSCRGQILQVDDGRQVLGQGE